jgi:hypothetical protein
MARTRERRRAIGEAMRALSISPYRGTVIARSGVLAGVRMTVPPYSDVGLLSLGDRARDDQLLRTLFSRLIREEEFGRTLETPARAFTELTLLHIPSGSTFEIEIKPLP